MDDFSKKADQAEVARREWVEPVIEVIEAADAEGGLRGGGGEGGRYS